MEEVLEEIELSQYRIGILEDERRDLILSLQENEVRTGNLKCYQENLKTSKRFT